jgi:hypothetical protein
MKNSEHRLFMNCLLVMLLLISSSCAVAKEPLSFYVSNDVGSDTNPGTQEQPFQTIQKAKQTVREHIAKGMKADITVYIRQGEYHFEKPLRFKEADSGRNGFKVIYKGYKNENVKLVGGREISGWSFYTDGIYQAKVESGFANLMENEQLGTMARTPNKGYFEAAEGTASLSEYRPSRVVIDPNEVTERFTADGLQVFIWPGQHKDWDNAKNFNWYSSLMHATAIDWDTYSIDLEKWAHFYMHPRNRYYLRNKL